MQQLTTIEAEAIRAKVAKFNAWIGERRSWRTEEVPADVDQPTNDERSALEVWDWRNSPPAHFYVCYLSSDGKTLTTWTGDELARVTRETSSRTGWQRSSMTHIRAVAPDGSQWHGKGAGRGMCLKIHRVKRHA